jgi:serine/threonine protein kinase
MAQPSFIGRYEILNRIGQGGMAALYLARDPHIDRLVAVKLIHAGMDNDDLRDRFAQEARAAGGLFHPNIVTIFDYGEFEGAPFIVMQYIRGETLAEMIKRRAPLKLEEKLRLMEQMCAGLDAAHKAGVIHRDIKPANLMVDHHQVLKILDFGIARIAEAGLTKMSMVIGTPGYMSPEQIEGGTIDARSDVFAAGSVLYETIAYAQAFPGSTPHTIMHRVLNVDPPPLSSVCHDLPFDLDAVVMRALEKDVRRRYPDMAAFQRAIADVRITPRAVPLDETLHTTASLPLHAEARVLQTPIAHALTQSEPSRHAHARNSSGDVQPAPIRRDPQSQRWIPLMMVLVAGLIAVGGTYAVWHLVGGGADQLPVEKRPALTDGAGDSQGDGGTPAGITADETAGASGSADEKPPADPSQPTKTEVSVPETVQDTKPAQQRQPALAPALQARVDRLLEDAVAAYNGGDYDTADRVYGLVLALVPGHAQAQRGRNRVQQARLTERETEITGLLRLADSRYQEGQYDTALGLIRQVLQLDSSNAQARAFEKRVVTAKEADR